MASQSKSEIWVEEVRVMYVCLQVLAPGGERAVANKLLNQQGSLLPLRGNFGSGMPERSEMGTKKLEDAS